MHAHLAPPTSLSASPRMRRRARLAGVAQLVEHLFCKQVVGGSSPPASSETSDHSFHPSEGCPSGQREQAVNLPAHAYVGSNPTPSTCFVGPFLRGGAGQLVLRDSAGLRPRSHLVFGVRQASDAPRPSLLSARPCRVRRFVVGAARSRADRDLVFQDGVLFGVRQASSALRPSLLSARPRRFRRFVAGFGRSHADRDLVFQDFEVDPGAACAAPRVVGSRRATGRSLRLPAKNGFAFSACDFAGVAQLVERQPSKLNVEGSSPFSRSSSWAGNKNGRSDVRDVSRQGLWADRRSGQQEPTTAHLAQLVEHVLGKDEVTSSILVVGSGGRVSTGTGLNNPKGVGK
jgi:hypothetical protein